ncbi:Transcriptional repressor NF-X1 [Geodia barretti]|uniref:Transcriptional repressor NF-X1 n=2 Tax=Geodia barretti TaxID=519541 RepID=A0AA35TW82_GEOBA|nr:Transcriptional repressor NF-X1 [Geodia barretti]
MNCPCGATPLSALPCQDEPFLENDTPTCGRRCGKKLPCSTQGEQHICRSQCHNGPCPPCTKSRIVQCYECKVKVRLDCQEIDLTDQYVCSKCFKPCKQVMNCGRHQCGKHNCAEQEMAHLCNKKCMKRLPCGSHDCDQPCHSGDCKECTKTSIKKLSCDCGEEVRVQCGAITPECKKRCARVHACAHQVTHTCHNKETCPPCYAQVQRTCVGGHDTSTVYCYEDKITCNVMCGKPLPCGHKCQEEYHNGICKKECKQHCLIKCKNGSHNCVATCHYPHKCPSCKETFILKCKCGNKEQRALCSFVQSNGKTLQCGTGCTAQVHSTQPRRFVLFLKTTA